MKALATFFILSLATTLASAGEMLPQGISRLTHYPTWRVPLPGWDDQQLDSVIVFSMVGVFIAMLVVMNYELFVRKAHIKTISDTYVANSRLFSTIISYYIIATFVSVVSFLLFDLGKLWGMLGSLHSLLEVSLLLVMTFSRYPSLFKYFYGVLFLYFITAEWITLILPWPYDAAFFKFQGLVFDFALFVNFSRLYLTNKRNPIRLSDVDQSRAPTSVEDGEVNEDTPLIGEAPRHNILASILPNGHGFHRHSNGHANGHANGYANGQANGYSSLGSSGNDTYYSDSQPKAADTISLLVLAATLHVFGNTFTTLFSGFVPFLVFQFLYGIAYPIYAYYVALVPNDTRIRWFEVSVVSESIVVIVSVVYSAAVVGVGTFFLLQKFQKHDFV